MNWYIQYLIAKQNAFIDLCEAYIALGICYIKMFFLNIALKISDWKVSMQKKRVTKAEAKMNQTQIELKELLGQAIALKAYEGEDMDKALELWKKLRDPDYKFTEDDLNRFKSIG